MSPRHSWQRGFLPLMKAKARAVAALSHPGPSSSQCTLFPADRPRLATSFPRVPALNPPPRPPPRPLAPVIGAGVGTGQKLGQSNPALSKGPGCRETRSVLTVPGPFRELRKPGMMFSWSSGLRLAGSSLRARGPTSCSSRGSSTGLSACPGRTVNLINQNLRKE